MIVFDRDLILSIRSMLHGSFGSDSYKKVFTNLSRKLDTMEKLEKQKPANFLMIEENLSKISRVVRMALRIH